MTLERAPVRPFGHSFSTSIGLFIKWSELPGELVDHCFDIQDNGVYFVMCQAELDLDVNFMWNDFFLLQLH